MRLRIFARTMAWAVVTLGAAGCIVEAPGGDSKSEHRVILNAAPPVYAALNANLGDKIELASASFAPGQLVPGERTKVTLVLHALADVGKDYGVFVHLEDASGAGTGRVNADHLPNGGARPTRLWMKGETVQDEFYITWPPNLPAHSVVIWAGLWDPQTNQRLNLVNADKVQNDGSGRVLLARLPVFSAERMR